MKKLCFGVFSRILLNCCSPKIHQKVFVPKLIETIDPHGGYLDEGAMSRWATCERAVNIYKGDLQPPKQEVLSQKFLSTIIPLLGEDKKVVAILALLDIIREDEGLDGNMRESFKKYVGTTKNALLEQREFVLHEFLAAVFLYVTVYGDNKKGADGLKLIDEQYLNGFYADRDKIRLVSPDELQANTQITDEFPHVDNKVSRQIKETFAKAIHDFNMIDYMNSNPVINLRADLYHNATDFVKSIQQKIFHDFYENREEEPYKKVKMFIEVLEDYNDYLLNNMNPHPKGGNILVSCHRGVHHKPAPGIDSEPNITFENTVVDYRRRLELIYSELFNGKELIFN